MKQRRRGYKHPEGENGGRVQVEEEEHAQNIIDNLKARKPVIVNMEQIEVETAQRILDFMSGACYAVDGRLYKVSARIFLVAPANYDIIGSSDGFRE